MKNQLGFSALMLGVGAIIVVLLGFIAFKLYIEPTQKHTEKKTESPKPSGLMLNTTDHSNMNMESSPTSNQTGLANPASTNCVEEGGILKIMKNGAGAEFGLCEFEDNMACEEWALMRGQCPVGGVKTIGFDNDQQAYCAWIGGKTIAEENATCNMPSGKTCSVDALWNGSCI